MPASVPAGSRRSSTGRLATYWAGARCRHHGPASAARARHAVRRLIALLGDDLVPDGVHVELDPVGVRLMDASALTGRDVGAALGRRGPTCAIRAWHEMLLSDYPRFARLHIDNWTLSWPGDLDFTAEFH